MKFRLTSPLSWLAVFAFWTVFGVASAAQIYVRETGSGFAKSPRDVFNIVYFYWAWAAVTPFILVAAERLFDRSVPFARRVIEHVPVVVAVFAAQATLYAIGGVVDDRIPVTQLVNRAMLTIMRHLAGNVLTYVGIVGGVGVYVHVRRTAELQSLLDKTRLETLRSQLQPHFLFNTLNMVSGLVARNDPVTANRALARLGELLRESLAHSADQEVPLAQELASVRRYLEIAHLRMGERLNVIEAVAEGTESAMVPALILQPLVENAIEHGVGTARGTGSSTSGSR